MNVREISRRRFLLLGRAENILIAFAQIVARERWLPYRNSSLNRSWGNPEPVSAELLDHHPIDRSAIFPVMRADFFSVLLCRRLLASLAGAW